MTAVRTTDDGIRIYTPPLLAVYDLLVMGFLSPCVWRCPAEHYETLYRTQMSPNHADIGVGTASVLNRMSWMPGEVRIGLFDLQPNCLRAAARRLRRFRPETYLCNALEPIRITGPRFDSAALGGLLHCLPGDMREKGAVFDCIRPLLSRRGRVFGYTILNREVKKTPLSRTVHFILEKLRVINGPADSASQLRAELEKRFEHCNVEVVGCVAIFRAQGYRA